MDVTIRQHLSAAEHQQDADALLSAYKLIKAANAERSLGDAPENFGSDLYVLCAEQAFQIGNPGMSTECLQMYFKSEPPANQFFGQAYLCLAQLHAPQPANNAEELETSVAYYLKAIAFAKQQQRYYFLVYNASVLYWQMARPFLKPGCRRVLVPSLSSVVSALEEINENDVTWRAELMMELIECLMDAQKNKEAADFASGIAEFIRTKVPSKYPLLFSKMVQHKLIDPAKAAKEAKSSVTLSFIYKKQKLKSQIDKLTTKDIFTNLNETYKLLSTVQEEATVSVPEKTSLLIELAWLAVELKCSQLVTFCIQDLRNTDITDPKTIIILECLQSELEMLNLGNRIALYTKSAVESQLRVIQRLESTLREAVRLGDPGTVQTVCASLWNLCLPLLQHNVRKFLRRPLLSISQSLESIDSLLTELRCQIHLEIAHIEEDEDRVEVALRHAREALRLNGNGQYQNFLKAFLHRLQLRATLYKKPESSEDQATMIIEQAKQCNSKDSVRKNRALLVNAGICLAPDVFQMVLDSENEAKVSTGKSSKGTISFLCLKARHHIKCVQKTEGHLKRTEDKNDRERVRLWADLAKVARKQEVWDVCRTACRFCLLYDDGRWNSARYDATQNTKSTTNSSDEGGSRLSIELESTKPKILYNEERTILRTLAEIRFVNGEATIHLLKSEGYKLNDCPVPPEDSSMHPTTYIAKNPEEFPEWITYKDWISQLSRYATDNFLRSAELGVELHEPWITHNAAVYVLNYNKHLMATGRLWETGGLTDPLQKLLTALEKTGHNGNPVLLVMLSSALAKGLIQRWIPGSAASKMPETGFNSEKGRKAPSKSSPKSNVGHSLSIDPNGLPDVKLALEICEYALDMTNGNRTEDLVPISVRHQIISAWVKAKQLLQQQIGHKLGTDDEENNEGQNPMTRVLVALEMLSCNGLGLMDFTVPSLSQVFTMAAECVWSDVLVQLQVFSRLAHFAYNTRNFDVAMSCTQKALQLDGRNSPKKQDLCSFRLEREMLSIAACIQGQCIMENLAGKRHLRMSAIKSFQLSTRFASKACSSALALQAAEHFWHACLPFTRSAKEREPLKEAALSVIKALSDTASSRKQGSDNDITYLHLWPSVDVQSQTDSFKKSSNETSEDLGLRASLYELLFNIYADKKDWESGLNVLDEAIQVLPRTRHRLNIFKHRVLVKARLGQNFFMDIQKFRDESEDYLSCIWHHVALASKNTAERLACYQNAIDVLQRPENQWQKVDYMMEMSEWLYCKQFPVSDALVLLESAVDILFQMKFVSDTDEGKNQKEKTKARKKSSQNKDKDLEASVAKTENEEDVPRASNSFEDLRNIRQLEALARAFTLMAVIGGRVSPDHEQNCLMAYTCIMRIWQVSLPAAVSLMKSLPKNPPQTQNPSPPTSRKEKGKKETVEPAVVKEKSRRKGPIDALPSNVEEWALFDCPDEIREAFKLDTSSYSINSTTMINPTYSLYYLDLLAHELRGMSFAHLTLPVLHLAEVIAHDVVGSKSLSDLYHLRMSLVCADLKLYQAATYHEKTVGNMFISEEEQISCRQEMSLIKEEEQNEIDLDSSDKPQPLDTKPKVLMLNPDGKGLSARSLPYMWLEKADTLIELGFYQPARLLLAEADQSFQVIGDKHYQMKCLYTLSLLANCERNYGQAKELLREAHQTDRDAALWYKTTLSMTEAVLGENNKDSEKKACKILEAAISAFQTMMEKESNRRSEYGYFIASLQARKFSILIQKAKNVMNSGTASSQTIVTLLEICDNMSQTETDLLQYGHKEYRAEFMMDHVDVLRILANLADNEECKHRYYLTAYTMAESAISILEQIHYNIKSLFPINEVGGISLPIMRKLAKAKLCLADLSLEIIQFITAEESRKLRDEKSKGHLRVAVEEYVRATPDYNSIEQEWKTLGRIVGSIALSQLASILTLIVGCPDLKAKCFYLTGKCLYLLSVKVDPLGKDVYWDENFLVSAISRGKDLELPNGCLQDTNKQRDHIVKLFVELKRKRADATTFLAQASEVLLQSINCAISNHLVSTLSAASLQIASCLGHFDPISTGMFLALYQSCCTSMMMKDLVCRATYNTSNSQFAALLHLHQHLQGKGNTGRLYKTIEQKLLATSKVWEYLQINTQFFNIINELPSNFNLIVLQHSEDSSFLYGAVLEKSKSSSAPKGKLNQQHKGTSAKVVGCPVNPSVFWDLLARSELFKHDMMQILLKRDYQQSFSRQKNVFEKIQEVNKNSEMKESGSLEDEEEKKLLSTFNEIVCDMEAYLSPVLQKLDFSSFRSSTPLLSATEPSRAKSREKDEKHTTSSASVDAGDCFVLLADRSLMELPLEALSVFREEGMSSLSRDFSLQLLYNRIRKAPTAEDESKRDAKSAKDSKPKSEQKRNVKIVPTNRVLPQNCLPVDTHRFKYIVDPYNEAREPEIISPRYKMNEILGKYGQQFTALWEGIIGSSRVPSHAEWEKLMADCSAFLFYGTERFLAHTLLDRFAAMNFTECQLMILLDLVRTKHSFSRQSTADVQKSETLLALESPVETAILLSVTGVRSIMLNQWHATPEQNAKNLDFLSENLLGLGKTSGQTIHSLRHARGDSASLKVEQENDEGELRAASPGPRDSTRPPEDPSLFRYVLYGLPNMIVV
ncbi:cilia- and flagella-associated protein 46 [Spea bombifrons]|uniref:cilia- and flagella-associated protein 46 n=1 Tax=Spea bombifrons TaxID=233779 RepID=UPI00234B275C|nr:cilia- and flagella-associated protein 46 [Spea bombifrons]